MQKISSLTPTLRALTVLGVSLAVLLSYNFMNAAWSNAPANPPASNTEAPVNVSATLQKKTGDLWVNGLTAHATVTSKFLESSSSLSSIVAASNAVWSDKYCDATGNNCTSGTGGDFSKGFIKVNYEGSQVINTHVPSSAFCAVTAEYNGGCDSGASCGIGINAGGTWEVNQRQGGDCDNDTSCTYSCIGAPAGFASTVFYWDPGDWGGCQITPSSDLACGQTDYGTQSRSVVCRSGDGTVVANSFCSSLGSRPAETQSGCGYSYGGSCH